jgi:hypothetical protein
LGNKGKFIQEKEGLGGIHFLVTELDGIQIREGEGRRDTVIGEIKIENLKRPMARAEEMADLLIKEIGFTCPGQAKKHIIERILQVERTFQQRNSRNFALIFSNQ